MKDEYNPMCSRRQYIFPSIYFIELNFPREKKRERKTMDLEKIRKYFGEIYRRKTETEMQRKQLFRKKKSKEEDRNLKIGGKETDFYLLAKVLKRFVSISEGGGSRR